MSKVLLETELLRKVYQEKRSGFRERFDELSAKCRAFMVTPEEHEELLRLNDESEMFDAERLMALAELAKLRGTTLYPLMRDLGLKAPGIRSD